MKPEKLECDLNSSLPDWVIDHPEAEAIFHELQLDVECAGKSLQYVCERAGYDADVVLARLESALLIHSDRSEAEMAIPHAQPNQPISVLPYGEELSNQMTHSLFKSEQLEVLRLVMPAGKMIAEHKAPGEITVHCLEGRIAFESGGQQQELPAGHLLYLESQQPHALRALEDSSVLVTIVLHR